MVKNVGTLDAILRTLLGIALVVVGLVLLNGLEGNIFGIIVALVSIMPFYMAISRKCFVFKWLNISSIKK